MTSIALIGSDGAGKTTITRMITESSEISVKYLYMGINTESSNVALPTSRIIERLKKIRQKKSNTLHAKEANHDFRQIRKRTVMGKIRAVARLAHRLAEEWYRQLFAWLYQIQGYIVLYDRHFLFDFAVPLDEGSRRFLTDRMHRWCVCHLYPRPDLTIYLDAPAEILFARKGECGLEGLELRRQAFMQQGKHTPNFVQVDATQPLDEVYAEVMHHILSFLKDHTKSTLQKDGIRR